MKKVLLFALALLSTVAFAQSFSVIGYFPYWSQYSQFFPKDIRYDMVSNIHYASLTPSESGEIAFADESDIPNFEELAKLSLENGVKLIVSIGGFEAEASFKAIASSEDGSALNTFTSAVLEWVNKYNVAGIEIDWQNLTAEDSEDFGKLITELRKKLSGKILSVMAYAASAEAYPAAISSADYVTVFIGDQMDESSEKVVPNLSIQKVESAVSAITSKGVAKNKVAPVVPMYGKSFAGANGLQSAHQGIGSGNEGFLSYKDLMGKFDTPEYKVTFDEASSTELAVSSSETIVFNGIPSMKAVATSAKRDGWAGVAVYDLSQDHIEPVVSLLVTIGQVLRPEVNYAPKKKK